MGQSKPAPTAGTSLVRGVGDAWARHRSRLLGRAKRTVGLLADAEDVVQDAAVVALERAADVREPARLSAWVGRIVDRKAVDSARALSRARLRQGRTEVHLEEVAAPGPAPNTCFCVRAQARVLRPHHAEVLLRIDERGERLAAVASELGVTTNALTVRLFRARAELRDTMKRHCGTTSARSCDDCGCLERACCLQVDDG